MKSMVTLLFILTGLFSATTHANELKEAADKLCDKITKCMVEQMGSEDTLSEQMKQMAANMATSMCASFYEFEFVLEQDELYDGMVACYNSAADQNCSAFDNGLETPECKAFEAIAEKYSK